MRSLHARATLSVVLFATACAPEADEHDHRHTHRHDREVQLAPALPTLPSAPLAYVPHRTLQMQAIPAFTSGTRRITQKVLLLSATGEDSSFLAARDALDRIGVPYQALIATAQPITAALLTDEVDTCHFNSIIFSNAGLGYLHPITQTWESALTAADWELLADFELACDAREAVWYAWPSPDLGLTHASTFPYTEAVDGELRDPSFFARVRPDAQIPYRNAAGYRAAIIDPQATTPLIEDVNGGVLLAVHTAADGRQALISTVDGSPYLTHSLLLEHDMLRWLTRGMFVGKKRAYLSAQIDDIFLDNDMWVAGVGNQGTVQFRISGADLDTFVDWQTAFQARLPAGSSFMTDMAFNGVGAIGVYPDQTLTAAARRAGSRLTWLNHTWDHENMDAMSRADAEHEVASNCALARELRLSGFSCLDLVSPEVSGLSNLEALTGILDAGARYVVSDTSVTEAIRPDNPGTNPSFNVGRTNPLDGRLYHVPRHPTNIFYDVATPTNATDEYNAIYAAYYGRDLAYAEVIDKDSEFGLFYLLQGDIDPLMFHQANLADYGNSKSLYGDWVEAVANKYLALSTTPIRSLALRDIGREMQARGKLDTCGAAATVVETTAGRTLELRTTAACTIPVTGLAAAAFGEVEHYAGDPTTSIVMPPSGLTTIPLP